MNQALPLFIVGLAVLAGIFFTDVFSKCLIKIRLMEVVKEFEVDENVGSYFEALPEDSRKRWIVDEFHNQNSYGIYNTGAWTLEKLNKTIGGTKIMKNAPNYEILSNATYQTAFQYTLIDMRNTEEEHIVSGSIT